MFQGNISIDFWGECVFGGVYLINHTSSRLLKTRHRMKFYLENNQLLMNYESLVHFFLLIIRSVREISLHQEVGNVSF